MQQSLVKLQLRSHWANKKPSVLTRWHKLGPPEAVQANRVYFEKVTEFE